MLSLIPGRIVVMAMMATNVANEFTYPTNLMNTAALREPISKEELARIIINLAQRRGYLSNSKEKSEDDGVVLKAIAEFENLN